MLRSTNRLFLQRCLGHADARPAHKAVVSATVELDYTQLAARVTAGAAYLQARGINRWSTVGVAIRDEVEHLVATLSLIALGTRQIALASYEPAAGRADLARRVGLTHRLHDDQAGETGNWRDIAWPDSGRLPAAPPPPEGWDAPEATVFLRTSGTTAKPNIIGFRESDLALQAESNPEYAGDRLLRLATIEHNNSRRHRLYCVWNGGTNVFFDSRQPDLVDFVLEKGVTCLYLSRVHAEGLAGLKGADRLRDVRILVGGSAIPLRTRKMLEERVSPRVFVRYGTTETGVVATAGPGGQAVENDCGRPLAPVAIRITDDRCRDLPAGHTGRIGVRAPGMATGYLDNPAQTAERFREGWFFPGDLGRIETDGRLTVLGRQDHMIIMNGLNIFPREIETVLESHPAVRAAAAFPLESRVHGQIPVAAVELAEPARLEAVELLAWARPLLGLKSPRRIACVPELPRNSQGKVLVAELRCLPAFSRQATLTI
jgi:long-chain acyl-CoA synthetase